MQATHNQRRMGMILLKLLIVCALIALIIKKGGLDIHSLSRLMQWDYLAGSLLLVGANFVINNYRWMILLRAQNISATFWGTLRLSLIGMFFNYAMPGGVGGDVVKAYYVVRQQPQKRLAAMMSVFMDRLMGFFTMVWVALLVIAVYGWRWLGQIEIRHLAEIVATLFVIFTVFFIVSLSSPLQLQFWWQKGGQKLPGAKLIEKVFNQLYSYRGQKKALLFSFILSHFSQTFIVLFFIYTGWYLQISLNVWSYFFIVPLGLIAMALPLAPGGLGVGQAAFFVLFNWFMGTTTSLGPNAITVMQLCSLIISLPGFLFYLQTPKENQLLVETR